MRIRLILVLLLAVFAIPASAQDGYWQPAASALPASLTPAAALTPRDPVVLAMRRDRATGAFIGAVIGAVAGVLVAKKQCNVEEGTAAASIEGMCEAAGLGLGFVVGAIVGGIIGVPVASPNTR